VETTINQGESSPTISASYPTRVVEPTMTETSPPSIIEQLPSGQYLGVLENIKIRIGAHNVIGVYSMDGNKLGDWIDIGGGHNAYPSKTLKYLAYIDTGDIHILDVVQGTIVETVIEKGQCPAINNGEYGNVYYSWSNNDDEMAIGCGERIIIFNIVENSIKINLESPIKDTPQNKDSFYVNSPIKPKWSPDGKWIAFMVSRDHPSGIGVTMHGPYITNAECILLQQCEYNPILVTDTAKLADTAVLAWMPDNHLAVAPKLVNEILIYDVNTLKLKNRISLPEDIEWDIETMEISPDGKWIAIEDNGLYMINIESNIANRIRKTSIDSFFWITKI
jgi:WD40 repeat protein